MFAFYIAIMVLGQRFVHLYAAAVWLDALTQLSVCFLPYDLKVQLAAESLTSELLSDIRNDEPRHGRAAAAVAALDALEALPPPRASCWSSA